MKNLTSKDRELLESLCKLSQRKLQETLSLYLNKHYDKVVSNKYYTYAVGSIPIALVAHMDTVFPRLPEEFYYDKEKNVLWSPTGAGFDDRAGIFAILKILQSGLRPHIIFTTDEEKGAIGAGHLVQDLADPFAEMRYIIQLDRHGSHDCVFYSCDNREFTEYVETFGFQEALGSFSDISEICPSWGVAGVNLSIGYFEEHSAVEHLNITYLYNTIEKVKMMLHKAEEAPQFIYIDAYAGKYFKFLNNWEYPMDDIPSPYGNNYITCNSCHDIFTEYEIFPVKGLKGETKFYCPDCIVKHNIQWCRVCQEACETGDKAYDYGKFICKDCEGKHGVRKD